LDRYDLQGQLESASIEVRRQLGDLDDSTFGGSIDDLTCVVDRSNNFDATHSSGWSTTK
jgi:hypothetical protein